VSTVTNLFIPPPSPEDERKFRKAKTPNTGNSPTSVKKKVSGVITPPPIRKTPPKTPNAPRNNPPTTNKTPAKKIPSTNSSTPPKTTGVPRNNPPSPSSQKNIGHKVSKKKIGTQRWKLKLE